MEYRNYIFDFDGTLMDTANVILSTIKTTIKEMNLPFRTDEQCKSIIGIRTDEAAKYLYPELEISNPEFARIFRKNYDLIKNNCETKVFPGVIETLQTLRERGYNLVIASSRRVSSIHDYLRALDMDDWFVEVVGADTVKKGKPDPEPVLTILANQGWNANESLVIGDAPVDIMMGKAGGCDTCAVTYGNGKRQDLKDAGATYIIDHFDELLDLDHYKA